MLASENRLKARLDFAKVKKAGELVAGKNLSLAYLKRGEETPTRVGFVVSTKISKRAVVRNRIKRLLRKEMRERVGMIKKGYDLVFLVRPAILQASEAEIAGEVEGVLGRANLQK